MIIDRHWDQLLQSLSKERHHEATQVDRKCRLIIEKHNDLHLGYYNVIITDLKTEVDTKVVTVNTKSYQKGQ